MGNFSQTIFQKKANEGIQQEGNFLRECKNPFPFPFLLDNSCIHKRSSIHDLTFQSILTRVRGCHLNYNLLKGESNYMHKIPVFSTYFFSLFLYYTLRGGGA